MIPVPRRPGPASGTGIDTIAVGRGFLAGSGRLLRVDLATGAREALLAGLDRPVTVLPRPGGAAIVVQMSGPVLRLAPE